MRLPPITTLLPLALLAAAALTGCGGPGEDFDPGLKPGAEGITAVVRIYARAIGEGDGPRACSLVSTATQQALIQRSGIQGSCLDAVTKIAEPLSEVAKTALADVQVADISGETTTNASATATISGTGAEEAAAALGGTSFALSVAEARWGIDSIQPHD